VLGEALVEREWVMGKGKHAQVWFSIHVLASTMRYSPMSLTRRSWLGSLGRC
jgi:hypothetical protein